MGQSSSRQERSSPNRHPRPRSMFLRPASAMPDLSSQPFVSQHSRRHSTAITSLPTHIPTTAGQDDQPQPAPRRRSRLARSHTALTNTFPNLFNRNSSISRGGINPSDSRSPISEPTDDAAAAPPDSPPPRLQMPDFDQPLDLPALTPRSALSTDFSFRRTQTTPPSRDRLTPTTDHGFRSVSASLRRRRSPLRRHEDTSAMLTRLLSAAAAATAMSLTGGNADDTIDNLHSDNGGIDGDDGSFNGFLQSLSSGRLASTLGQGQSAEGSSEDAPGQPASLEFFRMFRFGSANHIRRRNAQSTSRPSSSQSAGEMSGSSSNGGTEPSDAERMVPVLIVGIRALNDRDATQERTEGMPSFLDSLTTVPAAISLDQAETPPMQEPDMPTQERRRSRRSTIGGLNFFSHDRNSRHEDLSRPATSQASPSDSPPGPLPPPGTPASPGLSALSSASTTPARRSSMSSVAELAGTPSRRESFYRRLTGTALEPTLEEQQQTSENPQFRPRGLRRRPRINSWASGPRHDTRRNGMLMEPSNEAPNETSSTRSWIIYILGGNYPENHPILTTPSLFTDSPTYEDMLLLSTLLGSAKPPVATAEDVASAGGLFKIHVVEGSTIAEEMEGEDRFQVAANDRCQICLSDYLAEEELRKLKTCGHTFHRECVDQWITTANNSCPLCRAQGVAEKDLPTSTSASAPESSTDAAADEASNPINPPFTTV